MRPYTDSFRILACVLVGVLATEGPLAPSTDLQAQGSGVRWNAAEDPEPEKLDPEDPEIGRPEPEDPEIHAERTRAEFGRLVESRSLLWDWMAIEEFALLPEVEVIPTMLAELRKAPPEGLENRSFLLAAAIASRAASEREGTRLLEGEAAVLLEFLRKDLRRPPRSWPPGSWPAWPWAAYNAAFALANFAGEGAELEELLLDDSMPATLRAAIVLGLAEAGRTSVLEKVGPLLDAADALRNRQDQARLREAAAWAAARLCAPALRGELSGRGKASGAGGIEEDDETVAEAWGIPAGARRDADRPKRPGPGSTPAARPEARKGLDAPERKTECMAMIRDLLDEKALAARTRLQVARALQHAWGTEVAYLAAESWRQMAADRERKAEGKASRTSVRFFGIPSSGGNRVVFLLDGSDSMLNLLNEAEKDALWALLQEGADPELAGGAVAEAPERTEKPRHRGKTGVGSGRRSGLSAIDRNAWEAVKTRFDAARVHLKHTLILMSPEVEFAVVLFGSEAERITTRGS